MGKIKVMDKHLAGLIAAGEVVERPSSIVKELVENSIDAGATAVTVEIQNGGVSYIRVTDNGSGILREDVPFAFLRHATSKLLDESQMDHIGTLGFRGEALASIAAVARVELLTRTADEVAGTRYTIEGGEQMGCDDAGCPVGTTIIIRDIFYNTPARMKFLKKDISESNAIAAVLDRIALSHPEISVRFIKDGKEQLYSPGDHQLESAIFAVFGKEFTKSLIPADYTYNGTRAWGFVSKPGSARGTRSMQIFFINGRFVKSRTACAALEQAFKGCVMTGKFPACVLHLTVPLNVVDVNVHPAKIEVRFVNERPIFDAVYYAVKSAIEASPEKTQIKLQGAAAVRKSLPVPGMDDARLQINQYSQKGEMSLIKTAPLTIDTVQTSGAIHQGSLRSDISVEYETELSPAYPPAEQADGSLQNDETQSELPAHKEKMFPSGDVSVVPAQQTTLQENIHIIGQNSVTEQEEPSLTSEHLKLAANPVPRVIGEAFHTYILLEAGNELILIDKHAAHERMLYEQFKTELKVSSQMLLSPMTIMLDKLGYSAILENAESLKEGGFEVEDFGPGTILVRAAPIYLEAYAIEDVMNELADKFASVSDWAMPERLDWLYHSIACRAAVKGGDKSSPLELYTIAQKSIEGDVRYCPHGRPIATRLRRREIEKQFGRV